MPAAQVNFATNSSGVADSGSSTTQTTTALSVTSGNLLVVAIRYETSLTTCTFSDTAGNTYTPIADIADPSGAGIHMAYVANCAGNASNVVTATLGVAKGYRKLWQVQYSGIATSGSLADSDSASGSSAAPATPAMTATGAGVVVAFCGAFSIDGKTAGSGYALVGGSGVGSYSAFEEKFISVAGTETPDMSQTAGTWAIIGAIFNEASGGGGGNTLWAQSLV